MKRVLITDIGCFKSLRVIILHVPVLIQSCLFGFKEPLQLCGLVSLCSNLFGKMK